MQLAEIRKQYPQYNDLTDQQLAEGLHKKYYSDLPFEDFAGRIGLTGERVTTPKETTPTSGYSEEELAEARALLADTGTPGFFENITSGLGAGFTGIFETAALGAATLLNEGNEEEARRVIQEAADEMTPSGGDKDAISYQLAQGVGSILGFFPTVLLGKAALPAAGALAIGAAAGEASERAREAGATEEERTTAAGLAAPVGLLEVTPLGRFAKALRMPAVGDAIESLSDTIVGGITDRIGAGAMREIGDRVSNAAVTGGLEGAQETATEIAQNLIQQQVYDPEQELLGGVSQAFGIGGGAGAIVQALVDTFTGRRARTPTGEVQDADTQPESGTTVDGLPTPDGGLGDTTVTDDLTDDVPGGVGVPADTTADARVGEAGVGDSLIDATKQQVDESTAVFNEAQAGYDAEIARLMQTAGMTEEEADIQINSRQPQLKEAVEEAKTRKTKLEEKLRLAQEEVATKKKEQDLLSVTPAPLPAETTPASEQTVAQRLDTLNVPKGAPIRKRLKDVDISTPEGFARLQEELRKYAANPRANEAARASINKVLEAGDEAAAPLAAMEEQLAPEPAGRTKTITETSADGTTTTRTEDVPELTGLDTPINDIEDGKIVPKSARQILAEQQRVKQEQDKRRERLNDPKKLAEYAEETGQTVEEAQALLEQNTVNNAAREDELDDIVDRPEFKELQAEEKAKASKIKFKDTTEETAPEPEAVAEPEPAKLTTAEENSLLSQIEGALTYARQKQKAAQEAYMQVQARARAQIIDEAARQGTGISPQALPGLINERVSQSPEAAEFNEVSAQVNALAEGSRAITSGQAAEQGEGLGRTRMSSRINQTLRTVELLNKEREARAETADSDKKQEPEAHVVPDALPERDAALARVAAAKGYPRGPKLIPANAFQLYASKTSRPEDVLNYIAFDIVFGSNKLKKNKNKAPSPAFVDSAEPKISLEEVRAYLGIPEGTIPQKEQDRARKELGEDADYFVKRELDRGLFHRIVALRALNYVFDRASPEAKTLLLERIALFKRQQRAAKGAYVRLGMDPDSVSSSADLLGAVTKEDLAAEEAKRLDAVDMRESTEAIRKELGIKQSMGRLLGSEQTVGGRLVELNDYAIAAVHNETAKLLQEAPYADILTVQGASPAVTAAFESDAVQSKIRELRAAGEFKGKVKRKKTPLTRQESVKKLTQDLNQEAAKADKALETTTDADVEALLLPEEEVNRLIDDARESGLEESYDDTNLDYEIDLNMARLGIPSDLSLNALLASENPVHPSVYQAVSEGDLYFALKRMANTVGNTRLAKILNVFAANVGSTKVRLVPALTNAYGNPVAGQFDPETNTISLNADVTLVPHALAHEMAHAVTLNEIRNNPSSATVRRLNKIFNDLKGRLDTAYGAQSLEEFVAELMTNEQFRAKVARLTVRGSKLAALRDFIHTVRNFLRRLIGIQPKPVTTPLAEIDNLIDSIIDPAPYSASGAPVYLNSNRSGIKNLFKRMATNWRFKNMSDKKVAREETVGGIFDFLFKRTPRKGKELLFGGGDMLTVSQIGEMLGTGNVGYETQRALETLRNRLIVRDRETQAKEQELKEWFVGAGIDGKNKFDNIIYDNEFGATIYQVDPSRPQSDYTGKTLDTPEGNIELEAVWLAQRQLWNQLGDIVVNGKSGQDLFVELRDFYRKQREDLVKIIEGSLEDIMPGDGSARMRKTLIDRLIAEQETLEVYFPLERQGNFMLVYNLKPEVALRNPALPPYVVRFFATSKQRDMAATEARNDPEIEPTSVFIEDSDSVASVITEAPPNSFVNEILRGLNENPATNDGSAQAEELRELVLSTFISALPQTAIARSLQKRKRVPGYEKDSMLAFQNRAYDFGRRIERFRGIKELSAAQAKVDRINSNVMNAAAAKALLDQNPNVPIHVIARNNNVTTTYLSNIKEILDNAVENGVFNADKAGREVQALNDNIRLTNAELTKRIKFAREGATAKGFEGWVKILNQTAFMFTLGFNVSSYLVNLSQIPLFVYPYLGGEFGYGKSFAAIRKAQRLVGFFKNDVMHYYDVNENGDLVPNAEVTNEEQRTLLTDLAPLVKEASTRGHLDQTYIADMLGLKDQRNTLDTITGISAILFQHGERYNRQVALLSIYQLEIERQKAENEKRPEGERFVDEVLVRRAIKNTVEKTQMVNSGVFLETGMRYAQQGVGRLALMYKGYGVRMYTTMFQILRTAVKNAFPGSDAEARRKRNVAIAQLGGLHLSAVLFAGVYGIPLYGAVAMAYDLLAEEDEDDADTVVRKYLGELGFKGPLNEITGLDVASRVRLSGLLIQENRFNSDASLEEATLFYLGGPALSTVNRVRRGIQDLKNGELERGVENMMPSAISNAYKSAFGRYREDGGIYTRRQDPIYADMSTGELVAQFFGFPPNDYTFIQERNLRDKRVEKAVTTKRTQLLRKYYVARRTGDVDGLIDALEEMADFSMRHPYAAITPDAINRSMDQHARTSKNMHDGVTISPLMRQAIKLSNLEYDQ